ncbi:MULTISPECIES: bifunctional 5-dehydro-2-deoxygluconokinase/5-dehydro-2-deoxyphosphogluconate aldolase [Kordiimonas]|jgi:5-dehydro-2-deoxygluconokinase|uniref:5-dehydro-2-deoxygluconokinase n=1 Tax=Kordiimonas lacus TaxID=637679 RepID=A0A1G7D4L3_9PROT|nr:MULTISPECIES: 5-dehydro-2-deoxygluconokinase [Kordiimonas]SDE46469.1 5-dehydro-2-deoxygluconokinase [Kordiimonas lacus]
MTAEKQLDVICMGRAGVDLYGEQIGGLLEDMTSFAKYVGGCPANIAIGTARMGLKSAILSRVGNEHMGRFIRQTMEQEGVDVSHLKTDEDRLTALVILGIRDKETFPLVFYRENCADMALCVDDFDADFIGSAKALVLTGTHLSEPGVRTASFKAAEYAKTQGTRIVLDIDYRPVLWGLTNPGLGEERFVADEQVSQTLADMLPWCDLIVGTEEEFHIAGGSTDTVTALKNVRATSAATLVLKLGPNGCTVFGGDIPDTLDGHPIYAGFPVEVFNVLGAGDAFMSGLLRGYVSGLDWQESCRLANACGALVVSRHGCAPAIPSYQEVSHYIKHGSRYHSLRHDAGLEQLHWSTTRSREFDEVLAFAFDHRKQMEDIAVDTGKSSADIGAFKQLCLQAFRETKVAYQGRGLGILCDGRLGQDALDDASGNEIWIGRPIEFPASRPLEFEGGPSVMETLREWPAEHCVKCLTFYHPDDDAPMREEQERQLLRLASAARATRHELLVEVIPPAHLDRADGTVVRVMERLYEIGIYPDWWKLPTPLSEAEWQMLAAMIEKHDPNCRGVVLLGLDAPEADVMAAIENAAHHKVCKGFAVGRTIFGAAARSWFAGDMTDEAAVKEMTDRYGRLIECWIGARGGAEKQKASA